MQSCGSFSPLEDALLNSSSIHFGSEERLQLAEWGADDDNILLYSLGKNFPSSISPQVLLFRSDKIETFRCGSKRSEDGNNRFLRCQFLWQRAVGLGPGLVGRPVRAREQRVPLSWLRRRTLWRSVPHSRLGHCHGPGCSHACYRAALLGQKLPLVAARGRGCTSEFFISRGLEYKLFVTIY